MAEKEVDNNKAGQIKGKSKNLKGFKPEHRENFANDVVKTIPGVKRVDSKDKVLLKLNKHLIVRLMLRKSHRFTAYRNTEQGRDSMRIINDEDESKLKTWIEQRVAELKVDTKSKKAQK